MSLNLKIENGIAFVECDQPNSSANVVSTNFLNDFTNILNEIENQDIKAFIFKSAKPRIFIAGADIKEIRDVKSKAGYERVLRLAHKTLSRFEGLPFPKIALIHGACLGGGAEFALAFDYRIASDSSVTNIGLPEVQLGLIPGFGGCVRLPRLIGCVKSLDMILTGKSLSAKKAYRCGLVNEVLPQSILKQRGFEVAQEFIKGKPLPSNKYKPKGIVNNLLENFIVRSLIFAKTQSTLLQKTKGFYPAPLKALDVIRKTYHFSDINKALDIELAHFCDVAVTPQSDNLVRLFFLMDAIKKKKSFLPEGQTTQTTQATQATQATQTTQTTQPIQTTQATQTTQTTQTTQPIQHVGVLGAGVMGGGIAYVASDRGFRTRVKDIGEPAITIALKQAHRLWNKQVLQRRITKFEHKKREAHLSTSLSYAGFASLDCVIEAVTEDEKIKKIVIAECAKHLKESTVFASNTSSLSIKKLSESYPWPKQFVGMHFFNPVYKMPLVEIIKTEETSPEAIEKVYQFAKALGKTPIIVKDSPGFVVNRVLVPYLIEALWLLNDGKTIKEIDSVFTDQFGLPMGPLRLMDEVGLDVCLKIIRIFGESGLNAEVPAWTHKIEKELGLGRKSGAGFYLYKKQGVFINDQITDLIPKISQDKIKHCSPEDIKDRGIYILINEALKVLDEGVVSSSDDLDLALILGMGFPPFLGGAIHYAQSVGFDKIEARLEEFSKKLGSRFKPTPAFQKFK